MCEGKHDAWFFDEMAKNNLDEQRYTIPDSKMDKLQRIFGIDSKYIRAQYSLIIYGDNGRTPLIEKVLSRFVVDTVGKTEYNIHTLLITDDDGRGYSNLKNNVSRKLESLSRDNSKFSSLPKFVQNDDLLILTHPRTQRKFEVILQTVPESLEFQIIKKAIELKYPNETSLLENAPDVAIKNLASKYYGGNQKSLIRESVDWLKDETWVKNIISSVQTHKIVNTAG